MRLWIATLGVLLGGPALGQGHPCDAAYTQVEMTECSREGWELADKALNRAYDAAIQGAREFDEWPRGRAEETLRAAQRAWVPFRDAACEAEAATWEGGTGQAMVQYGCLERLTVQRTDDLLAYAEQWGG